MDVVKTTATTIPRNDARAYMATTDLTTTGTYIKGTAAPDITVRHVPRTTPRDLTKHEHPDLGAADHSQPANDERLNGKGERRANNVLDQHDVGLDGSFLIEFSYDATRPQLVASEINTERSVHSPVTISMNKLSVE